MSGLGRPMCQQWHDKNGSPKEIQYNSIMRFLFGDIIEAIAMVVLKSSGVNVESEQEKVKLGLDVCELSGTLDVVIDGKVWDIKSASPYAFSKKFGGEFGGYNKVKEDDNREISLYVQSTNDIAIRFYKKNGFKNIKLLIKYYESLDDKNAYYFNFIK